MKRMAIIIVHYRTPGLLLDCLRTLMPQTDRRDEVIVVDNASGEEHVAALRTEMPAEVTFIASPRNLGFAGANNLGIEHARQNGGAELIVLLNPDTLLRPGALQILRNFLAQHPEAACAGPRLEYPDGTPQLSAFGMPRPLSELLRGAAIGPLNRLLRRWDVLGPVRDVPHETAWMAGACVMMRRDMVERTGLLDDGFFMYYEEVDYFRRAGRLGLRSWYVPAARVVHLVGQSSGVQRDSAARRLPDYWFESRHRYFRKHFGYAGMLMADAWWLAGHLLMRVRKALTGRCHVVLARGEARDFLRHSMHALWPRPLQSSAAGGAQAAPAGALGIHAAAPRGTTA